jgi:hypothetical protein
MLPRRPCSTTGELIAAGFAYKSTTTLEGFTWPQNNGNRTNHFEEKILLTLHSWTATAPGTGNSGRI